MTSFPTEILTFGGLAAEILQVSGFLQAAKLTITHKVLSTSKYLPRSLQ